MLVAPPRVLQIINSLSVRYGGPPAAAVATALALQNEGLDNEFAYVFRPEEAGDTEQYRKVLAAAGVPVHAFPASTLWGTGARRWGLSIEFARWFAEHVREYDVIHTHGAWTFATLWSLVVARASRRRVFLTPHESLTYFDRAKSPVWDRAVKRIGRFVFMHSFHRVIVASRLEQTDSADPTGRHTTVVPHGVRSVAEPIAARLSRERVVVGFLARLHPKKNLETVIDALPYLDQKYELHVAGDGIPTYVAALHRRARELHVDHRIRWLGFLTGEEQRQRFFERTDVLAVPSAYECFGFAAVEALGAGVPVLVSPTVGVADVVKEFRCGVVVPPTAEAVAAGLISLADSFYREELAVRARRAAGLFSIEAHGASLRRVYAFDEPLERVMTTEPASITDGQ